MTKTYDGGKDEQYYTVAHSMVGAARDASDKPDGIPSIDAHFFLVGDIVPASLLGPQIDRLVRLGAIVPATRPDDGNDKARATSRKSNNTDDADAAAKSTTGVADTKATDSTTPA